MQPSLGEGHQVGRFGRRKVGEKTEHPVVRPRTRAAGDCHGDAKSPRFTAMGQGGDEEFVDGHAGPGIGSSQIDPKARAVHETREEPRRNEASRGLTGRMLWGQSEKNPRNAGQGKPGLGLPLEV